MTQKQRLALLHQELDACRACPKMVGPVVHGPPVVSRIYLLGQAPGPHEGKLGRPFAWTAGKTLFKWFESIGASEEAFRRAVYMSAVARCFPGKAKGGGDRKPDEGEIERCGRFVKGELSILKPRLLIPVGGLAIEQVLKVKRPLAEIIGRPARATFHGVECDVIALPHPSGASTWHKMEPGVTLLREALQLLAAHDEWKRAFQSRAA